MKREDTEKAATRYANDVCESSHHRCGLKQYCMVDFMEGADWRINSVWHDINKEKPQDGKQCLLEITYKNGYVPYYHLTKWYEMNEFVFHDRCAKVCWAYIEDLIPKTED